MKINNKTDFEKYKIEWNNLLQHISDHPKRIFLYFFIIWVATIFIAIGFSYIAIYPLSARFVTNQLIEICMDPEMNGTIKLNCKTIRAYKAQEYFLNKETIFNISAIININEST